MSRCKGIQEPSPLRVGPIASGKIEGVQKITQPPTSVALNATEKRFFAGIAFLLVLAITLPYLWAWAVTPQDGVYGGLLYNPDDQNVHLAWARQARDGHYFFRDLFTTESLSNGERPLFTNLYCVAIGLISRLTTLPLIVVYHLLRVGFAVFLLWAFYNLCATWTADTRVRRLALAIAAFSSGMGYLRPLAPNFDFIDRPDSSVMMPEAWTFHSVFIYSLFAVSLCLLCLVFWQTRRAQETGNKKHLVYAVISSFLLTNFHTYDAVPLGVVLLLWTIYSGFEFDRSVKLRFAPFFAGLGILPPLFYQFFVFRNSTEFQVKALTETHSLPIVYLIASYGLLFALAMWGIYHASKRPELRRGNWLPMVWMVVVFACIYLPVSFARKMTEGLHLPMSFLAAVGAVALLTKIKAAGPRRLAMGGLVALLSISSAQFVGWCLDNAADNNRSRAHVFMPPLYLLKDDWAAIRALDESPEGREGAVLSLPFMGGYVPRETGRISYVSHWAETLHFFDAETKTGKIVDAQRFYGMGGNPMSPTEATEWLRKNHITLVIIGSYETGFQARLPLDLPLWREFGETRVYRVP
jgi:hypothetical protein